MSEQGSERRVRRGLVLAGGGARGAYEVGVLRYLLTELGPQLERPPRFDIICGTSVGAFNGCYLGAHCHADDYNVLGLSTIWSSLRVGEYLKLHYRELLHVAGSLLGVGRFSLPNKRRPSSGGRLGGLLNTSSLDQLVRAHVRPWRIHRNIEAGHLEALTVGVTEVATGRTMTFVDSARPLPEWTRDPRRSAVPTRVEAEHALASAAIPFLFPAVSIGGRYYCDGSLRQSTPISPALRLGANRVLVISLRHDRLAGEPPPVNAERAYPNALFLFGKLLNALLLDPTRYDLSVLNRVNGILRHGQAAYGPRFHEELGRVVEPLRGAAYRIVDDILVAPSEDIGVIAAAEAARLKPTDWGVGPAAQLIRRLSRAEEDQEADLLSYLLFDGGFAERLMTLGYRDAREARPQLEAFFDDAPYPWE